MDEKMTMDEKKIFDECTEYKYSLSREDAEKITMEIFNTHEMTLSSIYFPDDIADRVEFALKELGIFKQTISRINRATKIKKNGFVAIYNPITYRSLAECVMTKFRLMFPVTKYPDLMEANNLDSFNLAVSRRASEIEFSDMIHFIYDGETSITDINRKFNHTCPASILYKICRQLGRFKVKDFEGLTLRDICACVESPEEYVVFKRLLLNISFIPVPIKFGEITTDYEFLSIENLSVDQRMQYGGTFDDMRVTK